MRDLIDSWVKIFESQKRLAEGAIAQLSDAQLHEPIAPGTNSVAIIMNHMAGNMRSRWTGFLTSDGEKPDRDRESEFAQRREPRAVVVERWDAGWDCVFSALRTLTPEDLHRTVTIRGEPHSVPDAVNRQISHYGYHVGQILLIARILVGDERWKWLTIAPGGSAGFNERMKRKFGPQS